MQEIKPYIHKVHYYETDAMAIVHHSNYIRWFEEARMDYLEQVGLGYDKIEARGLMIPVLSVSCQYKQAVRFGDTISIETKITSFNGLKFKASYRITSVDGSVIHALGESEHCFVDRDFVPVRMKRQQPELYEYFNNFVA